jgi:hypothetical protein
VGKVRPRPGQCRGCLGWGVLAQPPFCGPCHQWRSKKRNWPGACRRCHRSWLVNVDGLCGPCVAAVKESDAAWYFSPAARPRAVQLELIIPGLRLPPRMPFGTYRARSDGRFHPPPWARAQLAVGPRDDAQFCPPAVTGQLSLFAARRRLVLGDAARISGRVLPGWERLDAALDAYACRNEYDNGWRQVMRAVLRLALAARDADGRPVADDEVLDVLPRFADTAAEILRQAGLLDSRCRRAPGPRVIRRPVARGPRPCLTCGAWGTRLRCESCRRWELVGGCLQGTCGRCGQPGILLKDGRCRACRVHVRARGPSADGQPWVQLWLALPGAGMPPGPGRRPQPAPGLSPHRADPWQVALFAMPRDWRPVLASARLPTLTVPARRLIGEFRGWRHGTGSSYASVRALLVLVSWLGADAPFHEADVRALGSQGQGIQVRRVLAFLAARGMLVPDPGRQREPRQHAVTRLLASLPAPVAAELGAWVTVMRGQGRVRHPALSFRTIRNYLAYLMPVFAEWAGRYASLCEVTREDVLDAVAARHGPVTRRRMVALRSVFRALRQERIVFRDPTRGISLPSAGKPPRPLPASQLAGLLDRAGTPAARLAVALIAIHAATAADLTALTLAGLNLAKATLTVTRGGRTRVIYLDEITLAMASRWLRYRHQRWPGSPNPHLLVSQQTAADTSPVGYSWIRDMFVPLGVRPARLRQDRILDEARHTADPVHLVRVFGITAATAMIYVQAAHPGRRAVIPR